MEECKKCGAKNSFKVEYEPEGVFRPFERSIHNINLFMRNDTYYQTDRVKKEHLIYTCKTCGYREAQKCKDSK